MSILTQYNLQFYKQTVNGQIRNRAKGGALAEFLSAYTDPESINEGLININYYLNGGVADYENSTVSNELYTAWLDNNSANIYPSIGDTEQLLQVVPLQDFKTIIQMWLDFITV